MTPADLPGLSEYYGVKVATLGEECDIYVAIGHHDPRRVLAAFNAHARQYHGLQDLTDGESRGNPGYWLNPAAKIDTCWAVLVTECDAAGEPDHDSDCEECALIGESIWWMDCAVRQPANPEASAAFPVMTWRAA